MTTLIKRNAGFFFCLMLIFIVRGTFADQNYVPSGSMEPTIHVGDAILVNKMAYDLKIPLTGTVIKPLGEPQRGDIIVFFNPQNQMRMVKRLIGLPGDHLKIEDGFVWINGQPLAGDAAGQVAYNEAPTDEMVYLETVGHHRATIKRTHTLFRPGATELDIPQGQYFAMGDNRDNSFDSRGWGLIPRANIQGKAVGVIYNVSWNPLPNIELERFATRLN
jgi:signal peptidase I